MKRVIISGANGFLGGALVRELLRYEYEVYALDREGCSNNLPQNERVHFVPYELSETASLAEKLPQQQYHAFYHFAWVGSVSGFCALEASWNMRLWRQPIPRGTNRGWGTFMEAEN